ncbi:MAG: agmatinase [Alphaproteobacteria bacterium]|nr:agmatinase [Alphaproteobacteria bacterium]
MPPVTLFGIPAASSATGARAAVLGMPFDCGTHAFRVGARDGPTGIRLASRLVRTYMPDTADFDPVKRLGLVDLGDVDLTPGRIEDAFVRIEAAMDRLLTDGAIPVTMGGDGSVSLPQMRALSKRHPGLVSLHIDSHTDAYPYTPDDRYNAGTQYTHAAEEKRIDVARSLQVGLRGPTSEAGVFAFARKLGYPLIPFDELMRRGIPDVASEIKRVTAGRPVHLCFDMDVFDPSCAPGVATPVWGGLLAREGLQLLRALSGLDIVAIDVNTVSPPHDVGGLTAGLAAQVVYEALVLVCRRLQLDQPEA